MTTWREVALCRQTDPDAFFPEPSDGRSWHRAVRICRLCPVRQECLADAMAHNEGFGIWGGTTPNDRKQLRRAA